MIVIGIMSGTSADGIDVSITKIDRSNTLSFQLLHHKELPMPMDLREQIFKSFDEQASSSSLLCSLNFQLGRAFGEAVLETLREAGMSPSEIDLIGSHGQTIWHIPSGAQASTLQLGEPSAIAEITTITTISNFRTRDMVAGGQGAPLVPFADALLLTHPSLDRAAQNLGGMGNVTFLPKGAPGSSFAFDTGPANALIDAAMSRISRGERGYDGEGAFAGRGTPAMELVERWMGLDPFFASPPPRATGRERFGVQREQEMWQEVQEGGWGLSEEDYVASLTALTARSISDSYRRFFPRMPDEVICSGGGTENKTLMKMLEKELYPCRILISDEVGLPSASKEASAFAILAYESWHGRPGNLPSATGAKKSVVLGSITPGNNFERLLQEREKKL